MKFLYFVNMDIYVVGLVQIWNGSTFPGRKNWRNWRISLLIFRLFPSGTFDLDLDLQEVQIKISWDRKSCRTLSRFWFQNPHLSFLPQVHPSWTWFCNFVATQIFTLSIELFSPTGSASCCSSLIGGNCLFCSASIKSCKILSHNIREKEKISLNFVHSFMTKIDIWLFLAVQNSSIGDLVTH